MNVIRYDNGCLPDAESPGECWKNYLEIVFACQDIVADANVTATDEESKAQPESKRGAATESQLRTGPESEFRQKTEFLTEMKTRTVIGIEIETNRHGEQDRGTTRAELRTETSHSYD
ncbi:hypothetical protein EVAR_11335_1 [Eumeta japonica]|uniref:Uncharacterized protein n=1 Tax=Eumeta variegata TaxID=151549 RepID=A0A4C1U0S2_EUMVA|nr:hypothetical protein EVAR_11335_1 [Eumeta japonica]